MNVRRASSATSSFSIAVGALIVALTAPLSTADAAVIARDLNVTLDASSLQTFNLDVDLNGSTDFTFNTSFAAGPPASGSAVVSVPLGSFSNGVLIDTQTGDGFPPASRLGVGALIGPGGLFSDVFDQANLFSLIFGPEGNFGDQSGFIGLRFDSAGGPLFGFAQISVNGLASSDAFDLTIGAVGFNDIAGQAFAVPSAVVAVVPTPGSLSLLALAGFGLLVATGRRGRATALPSTYS